LPKLGQVTTRVAAIFGFTPQQIEVAVLAADGGWGLGGRPLLAGRGLERGEPPVDLGRVIRD
jgi:hypothetical protein